MAIISIFNNKGGVGKTTILWNVAHTLGELGKKVLAIDFDPQCNLSIAILGNLGLSNCIEQQETIRSYIQPFLQNDGELVVHTHKGEHTSSNIDLVCGDFWLNVYADSISLGNDLLTGNGISRFLVLKDLISLVEENNNIRYDYVLIDLPPSFSTIVRSALYSSDYFIVPCTSDNFSAYCVSLIGQILPRFLNQWNIGINSFNQNNQSLDQNPYSNSGQPKFAGWIFNGYDRKGGDLIKADEAHRQEINRSVNNSLISVLNNSVQNYNPIASELNSPQIGGIEDMNTLVQNSLLLNVPISRLREFRPISSLTARGSWAPNQKVQIDYLKGRFEELSQNIINICI